MKKFHYPTQLIAFLVFQMLQATSHAQTHLQENSWTWNCSTTQIQNLYQNKIIWKTLLCDGYVNNKKILHSLNINVVTAPLHDPDIQFLPHEAETPNQLAKLPAIAESFTSQGHVIAAINGGYFYRNDISNFKDNICYYKTCNPPQSGESIGDSLLQHDNKNYSTNCAFWPGTSENARAVLVLTGTHPELGIHAPYITLVAPDTVYMQKNQVIPDAIGAGPNLVTNGKLTVNNPNENLVPTLEYAANSAIGIINDATGQPAQLILFTVDGNNDSFKQGLPAMDAYEMGDFMLNYLKVNNAISMDQGGSTTLYVEASDISIYPLHVVSNANYEPGVPRSANNIRDIYDGLFIVVPKLMTSPEPEYLSF